jgi:hypothetical protein
MAKQERGASAYEERHEINANGTNYFIGIAIAEYKEYYQKLRNPVNDLIALEKILKEKYAFLEENTFKLINKEATHNSIYTSIESFKDKEISSKDNLVIFLAGHGGYDSDTQQGYFVTYDTTPSSSINQLMYQQLNIIFKKIKKFRHIFIIIDACGAGTYKISRSIANNLQFDISLQQERFYKPSRKVFTSAYKEQLAADGDGINSPFMKILLSTLDENKSDFISGKTLYNAALNHFTQKHYSQEQLPDYFTHDTFKGEEFEEGDFCFELNKEAKQWFGGNLYNKDSKKSDLYEEFLTAFPIGTYTKIAKDFKDFWQDNENWEKMGKTNYTIQTLTNYLNSSVIKKKYHNKANEQIIDLKKKLNDDIENEIKSFTEKIKIIYETNDGNTPQINQEKLKQLTLPKPSNSFINEDISTQPIVEDIPILLEAPIIDTPKSYDTVVEIQEEEKKEKVTDEKNIEKKQGTNMQKYLIILLLITFISTLGYFFINNPTPKKQIPIKLISKKDSILMYDFKEVVEAAKEERNLQKSINIYQNNLSVRNKISSLLNSDGLDSITKLNIKTLQVTFNEFYKYDSLILNANEKMNNLLANLKNSYPSINNDKGFCLTYRQAESLNEIKSDYEKAFDIKQRFIREPENTFNTFISYFWIYEGIRYGFAESKFQNNENRYNEIKRTNGNITIKSNPERAKKAFELIGKIAPNYISDNRNTVSGMLQELNLPTNK